MNKASLTEQIKTVCHALSNEIRIKIFRLLAEGSCTPKRLSIELSLTYTVVLHHLKILKNAGLVCSQKYGHNIYYKLSPENLNNVFAPLQRLYLSILQVEEEY